MSILIKGVSRQIIEVNDTKNTYYDKAWLVVKPEYAGVEQRVLEQEAKRLLRTTSLPLGEVAASVGMHDQSYFARRFKRHEGISPREYRARGYKGI